MTMSRKRNLIILYSGKSVQVGMFLIDDSISEYIHLTFGALFFLSLSYNSIFLFTKHEPGLLRKEKKRRNTIYRLCGVVMVSLSWNFVLGLFSISSTPMGAHLMTV
jgi:hypothetical protein